MMNEYDTITFMPERDFVGVDTFSYVIADSEGKTDEGKVSADVRGLTNGKQPDMPRQMRFIKRYLNTIPPVSEQEQQQKQVLDTTAQKIKVKVPNNGPDEMEVSGITFASRCRCSK